MNVRAKFWVKEIAHHHNGNVAAIQTATIKLSPVFDDANKDWSRFTPQGEISMLITNPSAIAAFEIGKKYYVDFTAED